MKMKYIFLFILSLIFLAIGYFYTFPKRKNTTHLFLTQYIQLENKPINWSLLNINIQLKNNQQNPIESSLDPQKKHFISFSGCETLTQNPDSLSKKLRKEPAENTQNPTSSLFQKIGCGLIQTIIPLSF